MITRRGTLGATAVGAALTFAPQSWASEIGRSSKRAEPLAPVLGLYHAYFTELTRQFSASAQGEHNDGPRSGRLADRIFLSSPSSVPAAHQSDWYAKQYETVIRGAAGQIDKRHPELADQIASLDQRIEKHRSRIAALRISGESEWAKVASAKRLNPESPHYPEMRHNFLVDAGHVDQILAASRAIDGMLNQKQALRKAAYGTTESRLLTALDDLSSARKASRIASRRSPRPTRSAYSFDRDMKAICGVTVNANCTNQFERLSRGFAKTGEHLLKIASQST